MQAALAETNRMGAWNKLQVEGQPQESIEQILPIFQKTLWRPIGRKLCYTGCDNLTTLGFLLLCLLISYSKFLALTIFATTVLRQCLTNEHPKKWKWCPFPIEVNKILKE